MPFRITKKKGLFEIQFNFPKISEKSLVSEKKIFQKLMQYKVQHNCDMKNFSCLQSE